LCRSEEDVEEVDKEMVVSFFKAPRVRPGCFTPIRSESAGGRGKLADGKGVAEPLAPLTTPGFE
jgi:hypothetical protein